jgi:hypothetical protein
MTHLMRNILLAVSTLIAGACDAAAGREVRVSMALAAEHRAGGRPDHFVTATGWDVTLDEAVMVLGPIYLFENPPPTASLLPWWRPDGWLVRTARAHAGDQHFSGGAVLAEYVGQLAFDVRRGEPVALGQYTATAGWARSFSVVLDPPRPVREETTHGHQAWVRGHATKDGMTVPFEGGLDIPDAGRMRRVEGLPLDALLEDGGIFTLVVHPDAWFDMADFGKLPIESGDAARSLTRETQPGAAWFNAARGANAFTGRYD